MLTIKSTDIHGIAKMSCSLDNGYYWQYWHFEEIIDDMGNHYYMVDGKHVSKEEGNEIFIKAKKSHEHWLTTSEAEEFFSRKFNRKFNAKNTFEVTKSVKTISYDDMIKKYNDAYDPYTAYIDNYKQQKAAEEANRKISEEIRWFTELKKVNEDYLFCMSSIN